MDLFAPPVETWQRVSPKLLILRRVVLICFGVLLLGAWTLLVILRNTPSWLLVLVYVAILAGIGWCWIWVGRVVAAWGYAEEEQELLVTRGRMFRSLTVVPYGRMQFVDVKAGPIDQLLGIAQVHLHTASPVTGAFIPGLPKAEAARLRDRLTAMGESHSAGL